MAAKRTPSVPPSRSIRAARIQARAKSPGLQWGLGLAVLGLLGGFVGGALFTQAGRRAVNRYVLAHKRVTFPEGSTRFDVAQRLQDAHICDRGAFLLATESAPLLAELGIKSDSAEGYLFPATYAWPNDSDPADVIRRMKREFDRRTSALLATAIAGDAPAGWDARSRLVLASVVEKEAQAPEERGHIAGVLIRRLTLPEFTRHVLESDPTAAYPCQRAKAMPQVAATAPALCATYTGTITPALLHDTTNIYSTYTHSGLPPGPICNPGLAALRAAVLPDVTDDLFFVARGSGRHTFSKTYEEHMRAVRSVEVRAR